MNYVHQIVIHVVTSLIARLVQVVTHGAEVLVTEIQVVGLISTIIMDRV